MLSDIVKEFKDDFMRRYEHEILPSHRPALSAWEKCRTFANKIMLIECKKCGNMNFVPHSCGHRNCPHCQNYETDEWIYRQKNKLLPVEHYLITFTMPSELNRFAWYNQQDVYSELIVQAWNIIKCFFASENGMPGAIAVLHTHTRDLRYHPHVHFLVPNVIIDIEHNTAKLEVDFFSDLEKLGLEFGGLVWMALKKRLEKKNIIPPTPKWDNWKINCKNVGSGEGTLLYLGRNLYKGPLLEKDIISCSDGNVTFEYVDTHTGEVTCKTLKGTKFLWALLQHVLPKSFRRIRNFGFMSGNSKNGEKIKNILKMFMSPKQQKESLSEPPQRPQFICSCCGSPMEIIDTQIKKYTPPAINITDRMRM